MDKYIELAKKLKALAEGGLGGERYNAQRQLDKIMRKYGITIDMLNDDMLYPVLFSVPQRKIRLFLQVSASVVGIERINGFRMHLRRKTRMKAELSKVEEAEIRAKFSFYWRVWDEQMSLFYDAFVQKNGLFPPDGKAVDIETLSAEERRKIFKILNIATGIERAEYNKPIGGGNG